MTVLFWLSVAIVLYVYVGYLAMLRIWARLLGAGEPPNMGARSPGTPPGAEREGGSSGEYRDLTPGVSIVLAARNEGARLAARIDNLRSIDYPPARRQIIVVSDGSTDDTQA